MIGVSKFAIKLSSSWKNTSWKNPKPNNNVRDLDDMSDAILETSIVEMRSDRLRLTRGGGRSLVAKLPPPKNRNKREEGYLDNLDVRREPRRGAERRHPRQLYPQEAECRVLRRHGSVS